jgi:hypothetical protein
LISAIVSVTAHHRRRGDRVTAHPGTFLLHLLTAACGTTRTSRSPAEMSVHWGSADSTPMMRFGPFMPSRPGEFHPEPLTDPDLILSHHPARATARRLPPSAEHSGSSRYNPVGPRSTAVTHPLCSTGITPLQRYYEAVRPSPAHRYFQPRGWSRLCFFPWHRRPGSHVPYESPVEIRAVYMPDAAWAVSGHPPS